MRQFSDLLGINALQDMFVKFCGWVILNNCVCSEECLDFEPEAFLLPSYAVKVTLKYQCNGLLSFSTVIFLSIFEFLFFRATKLCLMTKYN
jgi:hypothetical protein